MPYNILGLNFGHDGAAAIVRGGRLVCAISNERLSGEKKALGVTREMIDYVLDVAGLKLAQLDFVAYTGFFYSPENYVKVVDLKGKVVTHHLLDVVGPQTAIDNNVLIEDRQINSAFIHHHMAHAASAFYTSPYQRAACCTLDASLIRPEACSLFAYGEGTKLHYLLCPGLMIGNAYSNITDKLGIGPGLLKAGTTMALASYGKPMQIALDKWRDYGRSFYERTDQRADEVFNNLMWSDLSGLPPHAVLSKERSDSQLAREVAASLQYIFEQTILGSANELYKRTQSYNDGNLCLSGGSFLNSNVNMLLKRNTPFRDIHLFPGCGDDGTAVGAALYVAHNFLDDPRVQYEPREYMYLGRAYEIAEVPGSRPYEPREIAEAISAGKIVAFFQGGSEFGPRALGHRSILADPRRPNMKDILNQRVKHREWFRPFAPVVLSHKASEWFDIDFESKLMLFIAPIRHADKIPAVAHIDGSARLQTVSRDDNPKLFELIEAFDRLTGVPVLLNTSLNDNNRPLVETPQDAIDFFRTHEVDLLVLEDRVLAK